jgi:hydrogenase expression/formation protein HypC
MCLGIPAKIIHMDGDFAEADISGATVRIGIQLLDQVHLGNYVLVHAGYALEVIDEKDAMETLETLHQLEKINAANNDSRL